MAVIPAPAAFEQLIPEFGPIPGVKRITDLVPEACYRFLYCEGKAAHRRVSDTEHQPVG